MIFAIKNYVDKKILFECLSSSVRLMGMMPDSV